jgi:hypothetical protein
MVLVVHYWYFINDDNREVVVVAGREVAVAS